MADIYKPFNGSTTIEVDGVCYSFVEFDSNASESPGNVTGEYDDCVICANDNLRHGYEKCDFRYKYLICTFEFFQLFITSGNIVQIAVEYNDDSSTYWEWGDGNISQETNDVGHVYSDGLQFHTVQTFNVDPTRMTSITISNSGVTQLNIDSLINLETIICDNNDIESLGISLLTGLSYIDSANNSLNSFSISNNDLLTYVDISNNNLDGDTLLAVLNDLDSAGLSGGYVDTRGNAEGPSCQAPDVIASLEGKGWTVLYDLQLSNCGFIFSTDRSGGFSYYGLKKRNPDNWSEIATKSGRFIGSGGIANRIYASTYDGFSGLNQETTTYEVDVDTLATLNTLQLVSQLTQSVGGINNRLYRAGFETIALNTAFKFAKEIDPNSLVDLALSRIPAFNGPIGIGGTQDRLYIAWVDGGNNNSIREVDPSTLADLGNNRTINDLYDVGGNINKLFYADEDGNFDEIDPSTLASLVSYGGDHPQSVGGNK
jgi:hypothetical protein